MLGYDLQIVCAEFQENRFIIDGDIDTLRLLALFYTPCDRRYAMQS